MTTETEKDIPDIIHLHEVRETKPEPSPGLFKLWQEDINCVFERDPAARTRFEVMVTYPGVQAVAVHRLSNRLWKRGMRFLPRMLAFLARMLTNVDIHPGAEIGRRFFIDHGACVVIGETAIVGDDVTFYHGVTLGGTSWNKGRRHPEIGNGVLVGAGAKILGAIRVGENVRVGANSVVVQEVPPDCTVVGIPGKIVTSGSSASNNKYGINLDHHLIPDPVGKVIECLLGRMEVLEQNLQEQGALAAQYQQQLFEHCEIDNELCEKDCAGGNKVANMRTV